MIKTGFFDTSPDDRRDYTSAEFALFFSHTQPSCLWGDEYCFKPVKQAHPLGVYLMSGFATVQGRYIFTDSATQFIFTESSMVGRVDRIVIRRDLTSPTNNVVIDVKPGVNGSLTPPALQRDDNIWEISIAQIKIVGGTASILKDEREDWAVCGRIKNPKDVYSGSGSGGGTTTGDTELSFLPLKMLTRIGVNSYDYDYRQSENALFIKDGTVLRCKFEEAVTLSKSAVVKIAITAKTSVSIHSIYWQGNGEMTLQPGTIYEFILSSGSAVLFSSKQPKTYISRGILNISNAFAGARATANFGVKYINIPTVTLSPADDPNGEVERCSVASTDVEYVRIFCKRSNNNPTAINWIAVGEVE